MDNRTDIINLIIGKYGYTRYLEIGIKNPKNNFDRIDIPHKDGVDPNWREPPVRGGKFEMTSDEFFRKYRRNYDIVFIDGWHYHKQAARDFSNSLDCLNQNGTIILHDCNPTTEAMQDTVKRTGDVWKVILRLRCQRPDIQIFTVNIDHGCCVVQRGSQRTLGSYSKKNMTWRFFNKHRKKILNFVSAEEFEQWLRS